jgi:fatty acid desaturase
MGTFEEVQLKALRLPRRAYLALVCFGLVALALAIRLIFVDGPSGLHTYAVINTVFLLVLGVHHLYVRSKFRKGELR